MPIIKRRVAPVVNKLPQSPEPLPKVPGPIRRNKPKPSSPSPAPVVERIIEIRERNPDGVSYAETIRRYKAKVKNPLTAIRANCVECSGGSLKEVAHCRVTACALYPFRMGVNPMHKKVLKRLASQEDEE